MMEIEFVLMMPGNHHVIYTARLPVIPRVEETISLGPESESYRVHAVHYEISAARQLARVMLRS